ncbi:Respiratory chain complex assembly or maintenance protein [Spiromyces aspiralis]|uniref:Respiratory chain complex assembly or maintenance protein n=1 Tax=Spiromyces aspiralis TaxID=68401 RepID=A0ACC1HJ01_9FUNG|nr:Respiratory chain complex assembly or maintenance protein [Spiromyces aspiralis]
MHPLLAEHHYPECAAFIQALHACHAENRWKKFLGVCNSHHNKINACLSKEFEKNRKRQLKESRERQARVNEIWKSIDQINEAKQKQ